ncbi:hypothetical protein ACWFR0_41920, partial [Streptomyces noursei]
MSPEVVHRVGMAVLAVATVLCAGALARRVRAERAVRRRVPLVLEGVVKGPYGSQEGGSGRPRWNV